MQRPCEGPGFCLLPWRTLPMLAHGILLFLQRAATLSREISSRLLSGRELRLSRPAPKGWPVFAADSPAISRPGVKGLTCPDSRLAGYASGISDQLAASNAPFQFQCIDYEM